MTTDTTNSPFPYSAEDRGALPCSDCGGNAPEFVVSNEAWNALVRRNGPEQPGEYLCVRCFGERALATTQAIAARLEQVAEIVRHYAEDDGADPIVGKVREVVACHAESNKLLELARDGEMGRDAVASRKFHVEKEGPRGWTRWIQPIRRGYLMKCCDCGLVHEMGFRIVGGRVQFRARRKKEKVS